MISFTSLLKEMTDRSTMARWPSPEFTCKQASSYDRRSKKPGNEDWFANVDWSNFIRTEKNGGRTEHVMLDEAGPGAIVRIWAGGYTDKGTLRFYIDGATEPVLSGTADQMIGGKKYFPEPLSGVRARGRDLYAPIPYAKHMKITYDGPLPKRFGDPGGVGFWYNVNYRTYPAGTNVESFSPAALDNIKTLLPALSEHLTHVPTRRPLREATRGIARPKEEIKPGQSVVVTEDSVAGDANAEAYHSITSITLSLEAKDMEAALRQTIIVIDFDGKRTVSCPVGEFFGTGVGLNPFEDWWRAVDKDGLMTCEWVMPFQKSFRVALENKGVQAVRVSDHIVGQSVSKWDDRSLYFHCGYRRNPSINTAKHSDFNYITVQGRGVYMGDTLAIYNPVAAWWGEGDEKVWVDGESFPSHFGTGSEDYYGYAWGDTNLFSSPFHSQPRAGHRNQGHTTNTRVRCLDRIPFKKSLQFDMEVWNWAKTQADYSVATYWYGDADDTSNASTDDKLLTVPGRPK
ncbi:MAG: DUF2961 domain-containing protein [Planctomycetia bacterium]|nr:DUF2961 domain-containing protein [Planctomycetia bacterium]